MGGRDKGGANELIQGMDGMTCLKEAAMFVSAEEVILLGPSASLHRLRH